MWLLRALETRRGSVRARMFGDGSRLDRRCLFDSFGLLGCGRQLEVQQRL
jgi:hypothetical protein